MLTFASSFFSNVSFNGFWADSAIAGRAEETGLAEAGGLTASFWTLKKLIS